MIVPFDIEACRLQQLVIRDHEALWFEEDRSESIRKLQIHSVHWMQSDDNTKLPIAMAHVFISWPESMSVCLLHFLHGLHPDLSANGEILEADGIGLARPQFVVNRQLAVLAIGGEDVFELVL